VQKQKSNSDRKHGNRDVRRNQPLAPWQRLQYSLYSLDYH